MKKWLAILLCMAILMPCTTASAERPKVYISGDYSYILSDEGNAEIVFYEGNTANLMIPDQLDGHPVTAIGDKAFCYCSTLTGVTIPDSVTSIGDRAFYGCKNLTAVMIPGSVTSIGAQALDTCKSLKEITVEYGSYAETYCAKKWLPTRYASSENDFPYILSDEGNAEIIKYIGNTADLVFPEQLDGHPVTTIGDEAFWECTCLTSVTIPEGVISIGSDAFRKCKNMTSITIPDSVTDIGERPLTDCYSLETITVSPGNPALAVIDGVLFSKQDKRLVCYPVTRTDSEYAIPEGTVIIGDGAFDECDNLTSIIIPDSVTSIGSSAFAGCHKLSDIELPEGITSINPLTFYFCINLTGITIPAGVTSIGSNAFSNCSSLTEITIPDGVTSIGFNAFAECPHLKRIEIPDSVTEIKDDAFEGDSILLNFIVGYKSYAEKFCKSHHLRHTYAVKF